VRFDVPVDPDRDTAREWARDELAKQEYQSGGGSNWLERFFNWVMNIFNDIGEGVGGVWGGWGFAAIVIISLAVVALIVWLVVGPLRRSRSRGRVEEELGDPTVSARDLDAAATAAAKAGDWNTAVIEAYRALIRSLAERDAIDARPGMTALEASIAAATAIPSIATAVGEDADVFDAVRYGHLVATQAHYEHVLATRSAAVKAPIAVLA
jgi:hypothetical protein